MERKAGCGNSVLGLGVNVGQLNESKAGFGTGVLRLGVEDGDSTVEGVVM